MKTFARAARNHHTVSRIYFSLGTYLPSSLNRTCSHHEIAADRKTAFASRANEIGMAVVLGLSNAAKLLPNTKCQI
jgi:hypothetical protein